jgi:DnaJ-class molecular chaperone
MKNPYEVLGLKPDASADEIRKAYRRLAKQNHPDLHPGDAAAEAKFKEISSANDIVGDAKKRAQFDQGEIDADGMARAPQAEREFYRSQAEASRGGKYDRQWGPAGASGMDSDIFAELFGGGRARRPSRGADIHYTLAVPFLDAVNGAKKRVVMADGRTIDLAIPSGLTDGQTLRLRGQGQPGAGDAPPGDILVEIHVEPHTTFRRDGADIRSKLPVTIGEALAGAKVRVPTVYGFVEMAVPKGANSGTVLRLRGKGVPSATKTGDHFVELEIVLPKNADDALIKAVADWEAQHPYNPRENQGS